MPAGGRSAAISSIPPTHVLLMWLDGVQLAGNRLPPRLYACE